MTKSLGIVVAVVVLVVVMRALGKPSQAERATVPAKLAQGALILDVRTVGEFAGGHFAGATNIPVQELAARLPELGDTHRPIVVYCRSGNRSTTAKKLLEKAGFTDVTNAGGLHQMPK